LSALSEIATDSLKKICLFNFGDILSNKVVRLLFNSKQPNVFLEKLYLGANTGTPVCSGIDDRTIHSITESFKCLTKLVVGSAVMTDASLASLSQLTRCFESAFYSSRYLNTVTNTPPHRMNHLAFWMCHSLTAAGFAKLQLPLLEKVSRNAIDCIIMLTRSLAHHHRL